MWKYVLLDLFVILWFNVDILKIPVRVSEQNKSWACVWWCNTTHRVQLMIVITINTSVMKK